MTDESQDRIAQLEERIAQLEQMVTNISSRGAGTSHVFGRNPLVEKYASLGSQVFTTLRAGAVFDDTLGKFFPIVIDKLGNITINSSTNHVSSITFHETSGSNPDLRLYRVSSGGRVRFEQTTTAQVGLEILQSSGYGWYFTGGTGAGGINFGQVVGGTPTALWNNNATTGGFLDYLVAPATTTSRASIRLPHGTAPSSPVDGDIWTTSAGLFVHINGLTVGPLS